MFINLKQYTIIFRYLICFECGYFLVIIKYNIYMSRISLASISNTPTKLTYDRAENNYFSHTKDKEKSNILILFRECSHPPCIIVKHTNKSVVYISIRLCL